MECLYCGFDFENENKCPACGTDTLLMKRVYNASARLYNKGLEQALSNDFYHAAISLKKSIVFNKRNVEARNLLGLVYYHTGRLADAVKEWIISTNFKDEENVAADYIEIFQKNIRNFEKLNDSVKMYNHAIKYLRQRNDDVAVIRLKKAIDINPEFVDARNLLTLCYMKQFSKSKALDTAEKTLEIDCNNPVALSYIRDINKINSLKKKDRKKQKTEESIENIKPGIYVQPKSSFADKVVFGSVCTVCTAVIMSVLIIPAVVNSKNDEYNELKQNYTQLEKSYTDYQNQSKTKIDELESENQQMKSVVDEYNKTIEASKKLENLNSAQKLYDDGNSVDAAKLVAAVDITGADEAVVKQYNRLKADSYASACKKLFDEGKSYFDNQDFENAKSSFNMCITFGDNSPDLKYSAYYQLGKIALSQNDSEAAKKYFTEVKNNHPNSNMKGYADNYLKTL